MGDRIGDMEVYLDKARELVIAIESGKNEYAETILGELTHIHETKIFQDLGKLTRALHDTLNDFHPDKNIIGLTEKDIPDAKARLNYVIEMSEKAAHTTLSAVEDLIPICEVMEASSTRLLKTWSKLEARQMSGEEFRKLAKDIVKFFKKSSSDSANLKKRLNVVLLAQDYQDITGQTIRHVIKLVQQVEDGLIEIIKVSRSNISIKTLPTDKNTKASLEGPNIPDIDQGDSVSSQDEVDDLLSSLGF